MKTAGRRDVAADVKIHRAAGILPVVPHWKSMAVLVPPVFKPSDSRGMASCRSLPCTRYSTGATFFPAPATAIFLQPMFPFRAARAVDDIITAAASQRIFCRQGFTALT